MDEQQIEQNVEFPNQDKINKNKPKKFKLVWRPVPTILSTTLCFVIAGTIFVIIGAVLLSLALQVNEFTIRYDNIRDCNEALKNHTNNECLINIELTEDFKGPVMVYYQLENFYQDHRRYIKSVSVDQLKGKLLTIPDIQTDCEPIVTNRDTGANVSIGGFPLDPSAPANPCGLMAWTMFNDTFALFNSTRAPLFINDTNISWDSDRNGRYVHPENYERIQWRNVTDEHFMVWMRPAGLPDFRKLWGRIYSDLFAGNYTLVVRNNFPVASFEGKKSFVISTVNKLGGKNNFLGIAYLVVGTVCLVMALMFWFGYKNTNNMAKKLS